MYRFVSHANKNTQPANSNNGEFQALVSFGFFEKTPPVL